MGLATPVAIMAGTNAAAKRGILIRDGIALEKAGRLTAVLADKTGTLTLGRPGRRCVNYIFSPGRRPQAGRPPWPAAPIIRSAWRWQNCPPKKCNLSGWREIHGAGVEAQVERGADGPATARLGSIHWLKSSGVDVSPGAAFAEKWMADGATLLGLALDGQLAAMIALRDAPKPGISRSRAGTQGHGTENLPRHG